MATFTPEPQQDTTRAVRAMRSYLRLLDLKDAARRAWQDYVVARDMARKALATARAWRWPNWSHLDAVARRDGFNGNLKWAADSLAHAQKMLWRWQCLDDERARLPHQSFEDCVVGLSIQELDDAVDVLWRWQMDAINDERRDRRLHDAAIKCRLRAKDLADAPSPTEYIQAMNAALALGPAA